ncbi:hypothetical protein [Amycolatopsis australiensis]|uniref:Uncharacterized protein n=1 Tax=Amycolatopsis australiensis TaxID=546364 RepID=A0A1K1SMR8_9PSEU|nr:hypothetical protein [Amycolatopsis australiensis]SFW85508.1 hypothetical protein SAMN04489730_6156 [Amycolatopsis australiensis]
MRGAALRRDHVIAAGLAGAVVIVVGYASGIGLRPGGAADAATPPPVADGGHPATADTPGAAPLPSALPPSAVAVPPLPAVPVGDQPAAAMPSVPGDVAATPAPGVPGTPGTPVTPDPPPPEPPQPPTSTLPPPPPPGTAVPACQPGAAQQVLGTVGGLPLLGAVTTGLGVTGPDGLGALVLGYCRTADAGLEPAMVPAAAVGIPAVPSGR